MPVRHFGIPELIAGVAVERHDVGVIAHHEEPIARDRDATVDASRCIAYKTARSRTLKVPDLPARARVERPALVRDRYVHEAAGDDRGAFQPRPVGHIEDPLRGEPL